MLRAVHDRQSNRGDTGVQMASETATQITACTQPVAPEPEHQVKRAAAAVSGMLFVWGTQASCVVGACLGHVSRAALSKG